MAEHRIGVWVGSKFVEGWRTYTIENAMLEAADAFSLSVGPVRRDIYDACRTDEEVQVVIDDTTILTGFIDERDTNLDRRESMIEIHGRDKGGRLVDESMPLVKYAGLGILQLAQLCAGEWFPSVSLQNTRNRQLVRGTAPKLAHVSKEPPIDTSPQGMKKVNPGETRWTVLQHFLEEAELLAWSSADGKELIVGLPNYSQSAQFRFFVPKEGSRRTAEGNTIGCQIKHSVAERYSFITACGSGRGGSRGEYGEKVTKRKGVARNNPGFPDGTGKDFIHPKRLLLADDDVRDAKLAVKRADREMAYRDASAMDVSLVVRGHSQRYGKAEVLYAFDTMAELEVEELGIAGRFLIVNVGFSRTKQSGETTQLHLVPEGTRLKA